MFNGFRLGGSHRVAVYKFIDTSVSSPSSSPPMPPLTYVGCFENYPPNRISTRFNLDSSVHSVNDCFLYAQSNNFPGFGMEAPTQHEQAGKAECVALSTVPPTMNQQPDADCETETFNGFRLGGVHRVAVYQEASAQPLWETGLVSAARVSASSVWSALDDCEGSDGQLCRTCVEDQVNYVDGTWPGSWCAAANRAQAGEWLQVSFDEPMRVAEVETQGRYHGAAWGHVSSFVFEYSTTANGDGDFLNAIVAGSTTLSGPDTASSLMSSRLVLDAPVVGLRFRFRVVSWQKHPSMRVELWGSPTGFSSTGPCEVGTCVSSTGPCKASGNCACSSNYDESCSSYSGTYNSNEECTVTISPSAVLTSSAFSTESGYDKLTVNGVQYSGSTGPNDVAASSMSWSSDYSMVHSGWKICTTPPPPPPPPPCDCDYHSGGCSISRPAPAGQACKCSYLGFFTCSGDNCPCSNPNSPLCATPDMSVASCILGGGDCGGYSGASDCDCAYSIAGAARSARPHPPTPHAIATTWALGHAMAKW